MVPAVGLDCAATVMRRPVTLELVAVAPVLAAVVVDHPLRLTAFREFARWAEQVRHCAEAVDLRALTAQLAVQEPAERLAQMAQMVCLE